MYLIDILVLATIALFSGYYIHIKHVRTCKNAGVPVNFVFLEDKYKEECETLIREYKERKRERKKRKIRKGL